jgi:hypothetical protein
MSELELADRPTAGVSAFAPERSTAPTLGYSRSGPRRRESAGASRLDGRLGQLRTALDRVGLFWLGVAAHNHTAQRDSCNPDAMH